MGMENEGAGHAHMDNNTAMAAEVSSVQCSEKHHA